MRVFPPLFQVLRWMEYRRLRACVCDDTHTELSGRADTLGETATTKSRVVRGKCAAAVAERSQWQPTDESGEYCDSVGSHDCACVYTLSCAVHRQFRLARRYIAVAVYALARCYNWRPKRVGTRTPSTTSVQRNPIRGDRIGTANSDSVFFLCMP